MSIELGHFALILAFAIACGSARLGKRLSFVGLPPHTPPTAAYFVAVRGGVRLRALGSGGGVLRRRVGRRSAARAMLWRPCGWCAVWLRH